MSFLMYKKWLVHADEYLSQFIPVEGWGPKGSLCFELTCCLSVQDGGAFRRMQSWLQVSESFPWIWFRSRSYVHSSYWERLLFTCVFRLLRKNTLKNFKSLFFLSNRVSPMHVHNIFRILNKGTYRYTLIWSLPWSCLLICQFSLIGKTGERENFAFFPVCPGPSKFPLSSAYKQNFLGFISSFQYLTIGS